MLAKFPLLPLFIFALLFSADWYYAEPSQAGYDLVLEASPLKVEAIHPGTMADAVEQGAKNFSSLRAIVHFKIEKILKGHLPKIKIESPTKMDQMKDAVHKKQVEKVLLSDYDTQATEIERQRFRVGVVDPAVTFGIKNWETPGKDKFRLYLKRYHKEESTYFLVLAERESAGPSV